MTEKERSPMKDYTPSLSELETRLEKLERQNRRLKGLGLGFLLIVLSGLLLAQTSHKPAHAAPASAASATYDTLVVHRLELRDEAGKLRGLLVVKNGGPGLSLYDDAGRPRAALDVDGKSPGLFLSDDAGMPRVALGVTGEGPVLGLYDDAGKPRVDLQVTGEVPGLFLDDAAGRPRVALAVFGKGPGLGLYDAAGKPRAEMDVNSSGAPQVELSDPQGFGMGLGASDTMIERTGQTRHTSAASIVMFGNDKGHHVIWQAP
jgi:hypothetical protein